MRVDVRILDKDHAEITMTPNWLARLFGARVRRGLAYRTMNRLEEVCWGWSMTQKRVPPHVEELIACAPVGALPVAYVCSPAYDSVVDINEERIKRR